MTKQCRTQSDPYDGILQINGCFYSSSTFSELKTRKRKKTCRFHVSTRTKKKKKQNYFTSMTVILNHWFLKWKRKKSYLTVNPFNSWIHLHIYPPVHPVCGMCRYHLNVQFHPQPHPNPSHRHTRTSETGCTKACV